MQKLLILLTISLIGNSSLSNINLTIKTNINENNKNVIVNNNESDSDKLDNWHNTLSIKQDAIAKEQYLDSMNITTTKSTNSNFDNYNISFDNKKLQNMLKNGIINQDVYNIWSNKYYSEGITRESNTIVSIPSLNNLSETKIRESDGFFYIKNNKMFFIENKKSVSLSSTTVPMPASTIDIIDMFEKWFDEEYFTEELYETFTDHLAWLVDNNYSQTAIDNWYKELVLTLIDEKILPESEWGTLFVIEEVAFNTSNHHSKYKFLNQIEQNMTTINNINNKYHSGVQENYYIFKGWIDPKSIKVIPPIDSRTTFDDKITNEWFHRGKKFTHIYNYNTLISYSNYDSLWEFLNSNVQFDLNKRFYSQIGTLAKYQINNNIFDQSQSSNMLKKYWNHNFPLTRLEWTSSIHAHSEAEILLSITDNPWNKTINFNFTSILINSNAFSYTENIMY